MAKLDTNRGSGLKSGGFAPEQQDKANDKSQPNLVGQSSGLLSETSVPALLLHLHEVRTSGLLVLTRGVIQKKILFVFGFPHSVSSSVRSETLGQLLIQRGVISQEQLGAALGHSKKQDIRLGQALLALDLLQPEELIGQLNDLTKAKLSNCMRWTEGTWKLSPPTEISQTRGDAIDVVEVIIEGLKANFSGAFTKESAAAMDNWLQLNDRGRRLRPTLEKQLDINIEALETEGFRPNEIPCSPQQEQVLLSAIEILTTCDALQIRGKNSDGPAADIAEGTVTESRIPTSFEIFESKKNADLGGTQLSSHAPSSNLVDTALRELLREFLRTQHINYYQVLMISTDAEPATISAAIAERKSKFSFEFYGRSDLGKNQQKLEDLHALYESAAKTLLDDKSRKQYDVRILGVREKDSQSARSGRVEGELLYGQADEALAAGKAPAAVDLLTKAVAANPAEPQYLATLGWAEYLANGRNFKAADAARVHLNKALVMNPDSAAAHEYKGLIASEIGTDDQEAIVHLEEALRAAPKSTASLSALERLRTIRGEYRALEKQYRALLFVADEADTEHVGSLWKKLGHLCRDELGDLSAAKAAFTSAKRLLPNDSQLVRAANNLGRSPTIENSRISSTEESEAAYLQASLKVAKDEASTEDLAVYQEYRSVQSLPAVPVSYASWTRLAHQDDESDLGEIFALLAPAVAEDLSDANTGGQLSQELESSTHLTTDLPKNIPLIRSGLALFLGTDRPEIYCRGDYGRGIHLLPSTPQALVAGEQVIHNPERSELTFRLARALSYGQNHRALAASLPGGTLKQIFFAAWALSYGHTHFSGANNQVLERIWKLDVDTRERIVDRMKDLTQQRDHLDLSKWQNGMARTADRIGLLACGDLPAAVRFVRQSSSNGAAEDLLSFAESAIYVEVRQDLGLSSES